jgi:hypothetical protein
LALLRELLQPVNIITLYRTPQTTKGNNDRIII